jgi:hypothetical protein
MECGGGEAVRLVKVRWVGVRLVLETNCSLKWGISRMQERNEPLCACDVGMMGI